MQKDEQSPSRTYVILTMPKEDQDKIVPVPGPKQKIVVFPLPEEYPNTFNAARGYFQSVIDPNAIIGICVSFEYYESLTKKGEGN